ncbi:hypothetical protein ACFX15_031552 [Malus domestica]
MAAGTSQRAFELLQSVSKCNFRATSAAACICVNGMNAISIPCFLTDTVVETILDQGTLSFLKFSAFLPSDVLFSPLSVGGEWLAAIGVAFFAYSHCDESGDE